VRTSLLLSLALAGLGSASARAQRPVPHGRVQAFTLADSTWHRPRRVWVYTPPGYDAARPAPYPLVVAFDGEEYLDTMPLPATLDSLIAAGAAPAMVALLIDDGEGAIRTRELGNARGMVELLAGQLLPWVRKGWHVTTDPQRVIVTGSSAGGLGAAYVAVERPDLFGNVWAQSPALWRGAEGSNTAPYEWLTTEVRARPPRGVRFVIDVGALEDHPTLGGRGPNFIGAVRGFNDALRAAGAAVTYTEVTAGNHAPQWWAPRLGWGIATITAGWQGR
jgi:enterochelin esterase family protein